MFLIPQTVNTNHCLLPEPGALPCSSFKLFSGHKMPFFRKNGAGFPASNHFGAWGEREIQAVSMIYFLCCD